jgi:peptide subunit release factor 1 (eRF1)
MLSVYLDTSPGRLFGEAYRLAFRDAARVVRDQVSESERELFDRAVEDVRATLEDLPVTGRGLAIFWTGEELLAAPVPAPVLDEVAWGSGPLLAPLQRVIDDQERVALVFFDAAHTRIVTVALGEVETEVAFDDKSVPPRQAAGGWAALSQSRYARHREDHLRRRAEQTIEALTEMLRDAPFDRLILAGPEEPMALLRRLLPRPLAQRLVAVKPMEWFASEAELLRTVSETATEVERERELAVVNELVDAGGVGRSVLGLEATVAALNDARLAQLVISDVPLPEGGQCVACEVVTTGRETCPRCGGPLEPVASLNGPMIAQALRTGGRVEVVAGAAATRLAEHGGVGGWTRY